MDSGSSGIQGQLKNFNEVFHRACPSLAAHFDALRVDPQFYAFRWFTTLGTRELELPEVVRLWDSLLVSQQGQPTTSQLVPPPLCRPLLGCLVFCAVLSFMRSVRCHLHVRASGMSCHFMLNVMLRMCHAMQWYVPLVG